MKSLHRSSRAWCATLLLLGLTLTLAGVAAEEARQCQNNESASPSTCGSAARDPATSDQPTTDAAAPSPLDQLEQTWGVEIASLRLSARGYFVDFRYRVLDADKAAQLGNDDWKPYLIDDATGQKLAVPRTPKLGPLRQTAQKPTAGRIYYIFFGNSRGIVKPGGKVTVVVGDCRIEGLTVE